MEPHWPGPPLSSCYHLASQFLDLPTPFLCSWTLTSSTSEALTSPSALGPLSLQLFHSLLTLLLFITLPLTSRFSISSSSHSFPPLA